MMKKTPEELEFYVLLYRWAQQDFDREVREGFPFLSKIRSGSAMRAVWHLSGLPEDRLSNLKAGLLKRFHRDAVEMLGETKSEQEEEELKIRREAALSPAPEEMLLESLAPMDRRRFSRAVRGLLPTVFGSNARKNPPSDDWYDTPIGDITLQTLVCFEKPMDYKHFITFQNRRFFHWMTVLSWLGISSVTRFDLVPRGEEEQAAELLAELCGHYLKAVRDIVGRMTTI